MMLQRPVLVLLLRLNTFRLTLLLGWDSMTLITRLHQNIQAQNRPRQEMVEAGGIAPTVKMRP